MSRSRNEATPAISQSNHKHSLDLEGKIQLSESAATLFKRPYQLPCIKQAWQETTTLSSQQEPSAPPKEIKQQESGSQTATTTINTELKPNEEARLRYLNCLTIY